MIRFRWEAGAGVRHGNRLQGLLGRGPCCQSCWPASTNRQNNRPTNQPPPPSPSLFLGIHTRQSKGSPPSATGTHSTWGWWEWWGLARVRGRGSSTCESRASQPSRVSVGFVNRVGGQATPLCRAPHYVINCVGKEVAQSPTSLTHQIGEHGRYPASTPPSTRLCTPWPQTRLQP